MEFSPTNAVVQLCLQGMAHEEGGKQEAAAELYRRAWSEAANDLEKYLAAYYVARTQDSTEARLKWLETALQHALKINNYGSGSALPSLHADIAECQRKLGDTEAAQRHRALAESFSGQPADEGPFYHGTRANLRVGDMLTAGGISNYKPGLKMNHIYFTSILSGAGLAAGLAKGEGRERVYVVQPTGPFENDPNVTDKKFPGNPTCSYRSSAPLRILGELKDWARQSPEQLEKWRQRLAGNKGEIIN